MTGGFRAINENIIHVDADDSARELICVQVHRRGISIWSKSQRVQKSHLLNQDVPIVSHMIPVWLFELRRQWCWLNVKQFKHYFKHMQTQKFKRVKEVLSPNSDSLTLWTRGCKGFMRTCTGLHALSGCQAKIGKRQASFYYSFQTTLY